MSHIIQFTTKDFKPKSKNLYEAFSLTTGLSKKHEGVFINDEYLDMLTTKLFDYPLLCCCNPQQHPCSFLSMYLRRDIQSLAWSPLPSSYLKNQSHNAVWDIASRSTEIMGLHHFWKCNLNFGHLYFHKIICRLVKC